MGTVGEGGAGSLAIACALVMASCAMKASTLPKVTVGNTGCSPEELAVFDYNEDGRTWMAVCGTQIFSCSDAGRRTARCSHLAAVARTPQLEQRAQLLLQLPPDRRALFVRMNIMRGTYDYFVKRLAIIAALDSQDFEHLQDFRNICPNIGVDRAEALRRCIGPRLCMVQVKTGTDVVFTGSYSFGNYHKKERDCIRKALKDLEVPRSCRDRYGRTYFFGGEPDPVVILAAQKAAQAAAEQPATAPANARAGSAAAAAAPTPNPVAPAQPPPANPAIDASLRAQLDAHRDDVLACVNGPRAVVRVDYTAEGKVTVSLQGKLAGTPVEGCVKAAIGDLHVDGATAPGVVVQLIH